MSYSDIPLEAYAECAREFLKLNKVYRYRMKKISDMTDKEVMSACHFWYEENFKKDEYRDFEDAYLKRYSV